MHSTGIWALAPWIVQRILSRYTLDSPLVIKTGSEMEEEMGDEE